MKVAVLFDRFGPYHVARLRSATQYMSVLPFQLFGETNEYQWDKVAGLENQVTVFTDKTREEVTPGMLYHRVHELMDGYKPDIVACNGWSDKGALSALDWCLRNQVPAIVMSESTAIDEPRKWVREYIKRRVVGLFSGALTGGSRHLDYLLQLGMKEDQIFLGYDVIHNEYFTDRVAEIRKSEQDYRRLSGLPEKYFLASNRFIEKKNLFFLIRAFAGYRQQVDDREAYDLVLLGDGVLRPELEGYIKEIGVADAVHLPGFRQYHELPYYYAFAHLFVHASTTEQWGLVVNEAMAASLPVLVSERCGCAPDLVVNGENGFVFDPFEVDALMRLLLHVSGSACDLAAMGKRSLQVINGWQPSRFGQGLLQAAEKAAAIGPKKYSSVDRLILNKIIHR